MAFQETFKWYTANNGWATISTANSNLDGTGIISKILVAGGKGTILKTVIIKAQTTTQQGMIRLFIKNTASGKINLFLEIPVPIITKSGRDCSFYITLPLNYNMSSKDELYASTEKNDTFNVIAEGLDWDYGDNEVQYAGNEGNDTVSTANSNLDGTGTLVKIITAATASGTDYHGCEISSIRIKAQQTTTPGMVRFFLYNGGAAPKILFAEVEIPAATQNSLNSTFVHELISKGSFALQCDYEIWASTENAEAFGINISGRDWMNIP